MAITACWQCAPILHSLKNVGIEDNGEQFHVLGWKPYFVCQSEAIIDTSIPYTIPQTSLSLRPYSNMRFLFIWGGLIPLYIAVLLFQTYFPNLHNNEIYEDLLNNSLIKCTNFSYHSIHTWGIYCQNGCSFIPNSLCAINMYHQTCFHLSS